MTIEEKARAYDESLERAKGLYEQGMMPERIEYIFPELRESEDERIRQGIVETIKQCTDMLEPKNQKRMLDWLEKQSEKKPNIELIQRSWYMEGYHDGRFKREPKWIIKTGEGGPKYELNPRYGMLIESEQKAAEKSEKSINVDLEKEIEKTANECTDGYNFDWDKFALHFYELGCRRTAEKYDEIEYNRQRAEEKQVNEELEEEIEKCLVEYHMLAVGKRDFTNIARHFAQWGAEHFASAGKTSSGSSEIPNNHEGLDEAAEEYDELHTYQKYDGGGFTPDYEVTLAEAFKAGAKWAIEQGVKGEVKDFCFVREVNYASAKIEFDTIPELKEGEEFIVQIRKK